MSIEQAKSHVGFLVETTAKDVEEVRRGLPEGATVLAATWKAQPGLETDLKSVRHGLEDARRKVQDLRVAKSTFFALADAGGMLLRNDQEEDRMAGRSLFGAYPALSGAKDRYTETSGSLPEASGVRVGRADGQWVAAAPVRVDDATRGLYVTGWSWSAYAYRLEFALRGRLRTELADQHGVNEPLVYVFMVVGKSVYGAPVSPEINMATIAKEDPLSRSRGAEQMTERIEITGRAYGLAVQRAPALGTDVGVAVLRSET